MIINKYTYIIIPVIPNLLGISLAELTRLIFTDVGLDDLIIEPHVCDRHSVLRQCASLVWTDRRSRAQSFDRLEVLDETVLTCHSLRSQCQAHLQHTRTDSSRAGWKPRCFYAATTCQHSRHNFRWTRKRVPNRYQRCCCSFDCCWDCCYQIFKVLMLFHFTIDRH